MTARLTQEQDHEHAMDLLRIAHRHNAWGRAMQERIDDCCCFGLLENTPCGERVDTITVLEYEDKSGIHTMSTCSYHAIVLRNAIDLWRSVP